MESDLWKIKKPPGCSGVCCSDFYRIEVMETVPLPTLKHEPHPLFTEEKLQCLYRRLANDDILDHVSQLATNLVEASLPFWHSILLGNIRAISERDKHGELQYEIYNEVNYTTNRPEALTAEQQQDTRDRLIQLAEHISYEIRDPEAPTDQFGGDASTEHKEWIHRFRNPHHFWSGRKSIIELSADFEANVISNQNTAKSDPVCYYWTAFWLAINLVHELAHAAVFARHPQVLGEGKHSTGNLFFEGSNVAEPGYEWEARTFGGLIGCRPWINNGPRPQHDGDESLEVEALYHVDNKPSSLVGMFCNRVWPCPNAVQGLVEGDSQIGTRAHPSMPERMFFWNVGFPEIHKLFQQETWDDPSFREAEALWPERKTGICFPSTVADAIAERALRPGLKVTDWGLFYDGYYPEDELFDGDMDAAEAMDES